MGEIAETVKDRGAELLNAIPPVPSGEMSGLPAPTAEEYRKAVRAREKHLPAKIDCRRRRADARGIPGASEFRTGLRGAGTFTKTFSRG
jgi:hypothetical protein